MFTTKMVMVAKQAYLNNNELNKYAKQVADELIKGYLPTDQTPEDIEIIGDYLLNAFQQNLSLAFMDKCLTVAGDVKGK